MKKKIMSGLIAVMMVFSVFLFGACGGGDGGTDDYDDLSDLVFETDHLINLEFWRPSGNEAEEAWWAASVEAFNTKYAGKIEVTPEILIRDQYGYETKVKLAADNNTLPALLYVDGPNVSTYVLSDMLMPIGNYFKQADLDDFLPNVIDQGTYDERIYSLSIVDSSALVYYNKKHIDAYNTANPNSKIEIPQSIEDAWTWDEYLDVCKKLTKGVGENKTYGMNITGDDGEFMMFAYSNLWTSAGTSVVNEATLTTQGYLDSAEGIAAATKLQSFRKNGYLNSTATSYEFELGKASTMLSGNFVMPAFGEYEATTLSDWGATYYPKVTGGAHYTPCGGWTLAMTKTMRNKSQTEQLAAIEFIKYMTSTESCKTFGDAAYAPAARKSALNTQELFKDERVKAMKDQCLNTAKIRPSIPGYSELSIDFASAMQDIIYSDTVNVANRLTSASRTIDTNLAFYRSILGL